MHVQSTQQKWLTTSWLTKYLSPPVLYLTGSGRSMGSSNWCFTRDKFMYNQSHKNHACIDVHVLVACEGVCCHTSFLPSFKRVHIMISISSLKLDGFLNMVAIQQESKALHTWSDSIVCLPSMMTASRLNPCACRTNILCWNSQVQRAASCITCTLCTCS